MSWHFLYLLMPGVALLAIFLYRNYRPKTKKAPTLKYLQYSNALHTRSGSTLSEGGRPFLSL
jgi:hypothetical protein